MLGIQKQPLEVFCKKHVIRSFSNFTGKKSPWYRRFAMTFAKFLGTPFLQNFSGRMLLAINKKHNFLLKNIYLYNLWYLAALKTLNSRVRVILPLSFPKKYNFSWSTTFLTVFHFSLYYQRSALFRTKLTTCYLKP